MTKEAQQYTGFERTQTFVERTAPNPNYDGETFTLPSGRRIDNRKFIETQQWRYCLRRHAQFWRDKGEPKRAVPTSFRDEGKEGWWFPEVWAVEFIETQKTRREAA